MHLQTKFMCTPDHIVKANLLAFYVFLLHITRYCDGSSKGKLRNNSTVISLVPVNNKHC